MKNLKLVLSVLIASLVAGSLNASNIALKEKSSNAKLKYINETPIVDIATTNSQGQSLNYFSALSVDKNGLVFNNSAGESFSYLVGMIEGNSNLTSEEANTIIAIVNGKLSELGGRIEIAGKKADFILINPKGINLLTPNTFNAGVRFVNMGNVVLSTGKEVIKDKVLYSIRTTQGNIDITGNVNLYGADSINIISKTLSLNNGSLLTQGLEINLGSQNYNVASGVSFGLNHATKKAILTSSGFEHILASDVDINIYGTFNRGSKNVVDLGFDVTATQGSVDINSKASIEVNNVYATENVSLEGNNIAVNGSVVAENTIVVDAQDVTITEGGLTANEIVVDANKLSVDNSGGLIANNNIEVNANSYENIGTTMVGGELTVINLK